LPVRKSISKSPEPVEPIKRKLLVTVSGEGVIPAFQRAPNTFAAEILLVILRMMYADIVLVNSEFVGKVDFSHQGV